MLTSIIERQSRLETVERSDNDTLSRRVRSHCLRMSPSKVSPGYGSFWIDDLRPISIQQLRYLASRKIPS